VLAAISLLSPDEINLIFRQRLFLFRVLFAVVVVLVVGLLWRGLVFLVIVVSLVLVLGVALVGGSSGRVAVVLLRLGIVGWLVFLGGVALISRLISLRVVHFKFISN
jgi:hypothetical protein